jgi:hypothetical protein
MRWTILHLTSKGYPNTWNCEEIQHTQTQKNFEHEWEISVSGKTIFVSRCSASWLHVKGISNYHEYLLAKTNISLPTSVNCKINPIMHYIYSKWRRVTWRVRANVASRMSASEPNIFLRICTHTQTITIISDPWPPMSTHSMTCAHPCPPMLFKLRPCIQKLCNV